METPQLKDFDWQLSLAMSSDTIASLSETIVNVDMHLESEDGRNSKVTSLEMDKSELDKLIESLETVKKEIQQS